MKSVKSISSNTLCSDKSPLDSNLRDSKVCNKRSCWRAMSLTISYRSFSGSALCFFRMSKFVFMLVRGVRNSCAKFDAKALDEFNASLVSFELVCSLESISLI